MICRQFIIVSAALSLSAALPCLVMSANAAEENIVKNKPKSQTHSLNAHCQTNAPQKRLRSHTVSDLDCQPSASTAPSLNTAPASVSFRVKGKPFTARIDNTAPKISPIIETPSLKSQKTLGVNVQAATVHTAPHH